MNGGLSGSEPLSRGGFLFSFFPSESGLFETGGVGGSDGAVRHPSHSPCVEVTALAVLLSEEARWLVRPDVRRGFCTVILFIPHLLCRFRFYWGLSYGLWTFTTRYLRKRRKE